MVGGIYSFGNEFKLAESTDDEISTLVANFSGNETAGYYGRGILTVQLFGVDGNIINSANVRVKILESNSKEPFTPSIEFRDQILETVNGFDKHVEDKTAESISEISTATAEKTAQAETEITQAKTDALGEVETAGANAVNEVNAATEEAKAVIDGWTEQSARLAKAESAISLLQADKANRGYLQFNKAKLTTATNNATTLPLTLCATYECADLSSGYFNFLATHIVRGWTTSGQIDQTGSTSGFGFGVINNENYVNRIFGVKLSTPDAADIHVARHGYDCGVWLKSDSFDKFEGRHTFIATISEEITNGVPKIVLYFDGSVLSSNRNFKYNGGLQSAELGAGQGKISTGSTEYSPTNISTIPVNLSRLKIFNCVLPATKADDTDGIGYTVEDYHNGVDEPPTMQDASATYRALLSLQDYTVQNGSTQQVFDVSGNANDATVVLSEGGSLKGSNDIGVSRLIDFIKGQSA